MLEDAHKKNSRMTTKKINLLQYNPTNMFIAHSAYRFKQVKRLLAHNLFCAAKIKW